MTNFKFNNESSGDDNIDEKFNDIKNTTILEISKDPITWIKIISIRK